MYSRGCEWWKDRDRIMCHPKTISMQYRITCLDNARLATSFKPLHWQLLWRVNYSGGHKKSVKLTELRKTSGGKDTRATIIVLKRNE